MRYYIESGGRALGPFASETVRDMINKGTLNSDSRLSIDRVVWKKAAEFDELFNANASTSNTPSPTNVQPPTQNQTSPTQTPPQQSNAAPPPIVNTPPQDQGSEKSREGSRKRRKEFLNQKLSNRYFWSWLSISIAGALTLIAGLLIALSLDSESKTLSLIAVWLLGVGVSFFLFAIVLTLMFFHTFWRSIPKEIARVPADVAVGFLFVPLWQFYWFYVLLISGAQSINEALDQYGLLNRRSQGASTGLAASAAVCLTLFPVLQYVTIAILEAIGPLWFNSKAEVALGLGFFPLQIIGIVLLYIVMGQMKKAAEPLNKLLDK